MGTSLGLPRPSSIIGFSERTGERMSSLLHISRDGATRYSGESTGIDPEAQQHFLEARSTRIQKADQALLSEWQNLDPTLRSQVRTLVPRIGTLAIVSAPNNMHRKRDLHAWIDSALEGVDRTGIHRGMASVALQTTVHIDGVYEECFGRYAQEFAKTGNKRGFVVEDPLEIVTVPIDHIKSGQIEFLPEWLTGSLTNLSDPEVEDKTIDQGVIILTDEISFTHAVRSNVRASEFGGVFNLEVSEPIGVLSMHDVYGNGAVRFSRGSYPYLPAS